MGGCRKTGNTRELEGSQDHPVCLGHWSSPLDHAFARLLLLAADTRCQHNRSSSFCVPRMVLVILPSGRSTNSSGISLVRVSFCCEKLVRALQLFFRFSLAFSHAPTSLEHLYRSCHFSTSLFTLSTMRSFPRGTVPPSLF
jgi:hypothetical protein